MLDVRVRVAARECADLLAERALAEVGVPVAWAHVGLDNGVFAQFPGHGGLPEDFDPDGITRTPKPETSESQATYLVDFEGKLSALRLVSFSETSCASAPITSSPAPAVDSGPRSAT